MVKYDSQKIEYQLHIDSGYYNTLDIEGFSRMMKDPSYCYKFYWLYKCFSLNAIYSYLKYIDSLFYDYIIQCPIVILSNDTL